jgi:hypothetical protein
MFFCGKSFQHSLTFLGEAMSLPYSGEHKKCFVWVDSGLTCKHWAMLEIFARDKHSNLLRTFGKYRFKMFYKIGPLSQDLSFVLLITNGRTK